jgi:predicted ribosome quality control (RQC) complex YloA/Tae2 family protein
MPKTETFVWKNTEYEILIGKNRQENWELIDNANPADVWFHIADFPSCHVFLINKANARLGEIDRQILKRCACLCKSNTSSKNAKKIDILYTSVENIHKGKEVGSVILHLNQSIKKITL